MNLYAVILAAGKGTRMKSHSQERSKVGFEILGKPILDYVLDALFPLNFSKMVTIVGHNGAFTEKIVWKNFSGLSTRTIRNRPCGNASETFLRK